MADAAGFHVYALDHPDAARRLRQQLLPGWRSTRNEQFYRETLRQHTTVCFVCATEPLGIGRSDADSGRCLICR